MATWLGHGIAGAAVARAGGSTRSGAFLAVAAANALDLDLVLGLALRGDAEAYHHAWWSHSPIVALYGFAAVLAWQALRATTREGAFDLRGALRLSTLGAAVMLTHPVADFVLVNPAVAVPYPEAGLTLEAAARQLFALGADALFYGFAGIAIVWLAKRRRGPGDAR
jgi:hypothetical protein